MSKIKFIARNRAAERTRDLNVWVSLEKTMEAIVITQHPSNFLAQRLAEQLDWGHVYTPYSGAMRHGLKFEPELSAKLAVVVCSHTHVHQDFGWITHVAEIARSNGAQEVVAVATCLRYLMRKHHGPLLTPPIAEQVYAQVDLFVSLEPNLSTVGSVSTFASCPVLHIDPSHTIASWIRTHLPDAFIVNAHDDDGDWCARLATHAGVLFLNGNEASDNAKSVSPARLPVVVSEGPLSDLESLHWRRAFSSRNLAPRFLFLHPSSSPLAGEISLGVEEAHDGDDGVYIDVSPVVAEAILNRSQLK